MMNMVKSLSALVKSVLLHAHAYEWTLQGFGMLRVHIPPRDGARPAPDTKVDYRLNVWDSRYRVPGVSLMHDHPWHFQSVVISGTLRNIRYAEHAEGDRFMTGLIRPGPGGGMLCNEAPVSLKAHVPEVYRPGSLYSQQAKEIHISDPADGTVTFNARERAGADVARVFWPSGGKWVSAEPRVATAAEVDSIVSKALDGWES